MFHSEKKTSTTPDEQVAPQIIVRIPKARSWHWPDAKSIRSWFKFLAETVRLNSPAKRNSVTSDSGLLVQKACFQMFLVGTSDISVAMRSVTPLAWAGGNLVTTSTSAFALGVTATVERLARSRTLCSMLSNTHWNSGDQEKIKTHLTL